MVSFANRGAFNQRVLFLGVLGTPQLWQRNSIHIPRIRPDHLPLDWIWHFIKPENMSCLMCRNHLRQAYRCRSGHEVLCRHIMSVQPQHECGNHPKRSAWVTPTHSRTVLAGNPWNGYDQYTVARVISTCRDYPLLLGTDIQSLVTAESGGWWAEVLNGEQQRSSLLG